LDLRAQLRPVYTNDISNLHEHILVNTVSQSRAWVTFQPKGSLVECNRVSFVFDAYPSLVIIRGIGLSPSMTPSQVICRPYYEVENLSRKEVKQLLHWTPINELCFSFCSLSIPTGSFFVATLKFFDHSDVNAMPRHEHGEAFQIAFSQGVELLEDSFFKGYVYLTKQAEDGTLFRLI